ncbi:MAG: Rpn family recombination-promoting nuclease/putative transposase, partial [Acetatifactor sp.]|nr:Rpn family recombination-promoting nuclease/putative transposase [Acetatifactor sp.]
RFMQGEDTDRHGIRMDVYLDEEDGELFDLEPDNNSGKEDVATLPKRARFYHAKLDVGSLKSGEEYGVLRNVYVIFITTYDPFGAARMVYTIKNGCIEMPELSYEDGARTIFLYTKGTEGNPPEDLRELLYYMEHTSEENAKTEDLQRLHEMVTAVKHDRKVGLTYMKSFEIEQRIRKEGFDEGLTQGIPKGKGEAILDILGDLGDVPSSLKKQITTQKDETILRTWVKLAARAKSIEEFLSSMES